MWKLKVTVSTLMGLKFDLHLFTQSIIRCRECSNLDVCIRASAIEPGGVAPVPTEISLSSADFFPVTSILQNKTKQCGESSFGTIDRWEGWSSLVEEQGSKVAREAPVLVPKLPRGGGGRVTLASVKNSSWWLPMGMDQQDHSTRRSPSSLGKLARISSQWTFVILSLLSRHSRSVSVASTIELPANKVLPGWSILNKNILTWFCT